MKKTLLILAASATMVLSGCADLFEPAKQNFKDLDQMETEPDFAMGFLTKAYSAISDSYTNSEYATDDAVTNANSDNYKTMATGGWTSTSYNPLEEWSRSYAGIQYVNQFLAKADVVQWNIDPELTALLTLRMKAQACALRGILHYQLLRAHAGYDDNGTLLGVAYLKEYLGAGADMNASLARPEFSETVSEILADLKAAEEVLPLDFEDVSEVPAQYREYTTDVMTYNRAMGSNFRLLVSGRIVKAYISRVTLLAASDAFANSLPWADAANAAGAVLNLNNGISGISAGTYYYYSPAITGTLKLGSNPPEIIWRKDVESAGNSWEKDHLPPSLNGNGRMNPSQNLVDAFPMANGYPITADADKSGYDPANPYAGRDPRLDAYIIHNGSTGVGVNSAQISTVEGTTDGLRGVEQRSSLTGYYMKKRLRMDVNVVAGSESSQPHYVPRIRYTEIYLNYAEAANEAWGPKGAGSVGFSAYDVIKAIRERAGVGGGDDRYLEECAASKDKMRELIRNERRIELCFEGFRFWDIRRWKLNLNEAVKGINWKADGTYSIVKVEDRDYQDYMYYPPIPNSEILKFSSLSQNKGW